MEGLWCGVKKTFNGYKQGKGVAALRVSAWELLLGLGWDTGADLLDAACCLRIQSGRSSSKWQAALGIKPVTRTADGPGSQLFLFAFVTVWLWVTHFPAHFSFPSATYSDSPNPKHHETRGRQVWRGRCSLRSHASWLQEVSTGAESTALWLSHLLVKHEDHRHIPAPTQMWGSVLHV